MALQLIGPITDPHSFIRVKTLMIEYQKQLSEAESRPRPKGINEDLWESRLTRVRDLIAECKQEIELYNKHRRCSF